MNKRIIPLIILGTFGIAACNGAEASKEPVATLPVAPVTTVAPAPAAVAGGSVAVKAASSPFGQILVDPSGNTLYAFTNDTEATSTCTGTCAEAWPPAIVDASWSVAPGLDAGVFSTVLRDDGTEQLTAGRFPLYRFSGDARPGDINGQGSGNVWFVVGTDAAPISDEAVPEAESTTTEPAADPAPALVGIGESPLGVILVDSEGRTMYGLTKDSEGAPTCVDACATAWPPVLVDPSADLSELPNAEMFSIVTRADGSSQLKAGKWPLYYFSGDAAPGDANGQGSGGVWFVVAPDGTLIK